MKKKHLETFEKINEERKLNAEIKNKITKKVLKNFLFATAILLFFIILMIVERRVDEQLVILIYKIVSIVVLLATLVLFEVAYKKDNDNLAITSIEMFFLSIITLLTPYTMISRANKYAYAIGVFFTVYYAIKNFIIYRKEKNEYLKAKNDITQIIKKESKDELAQKHLEKMRQEEEKQKNKVAKKTTRTTTKKRSKTCVKTKQTVENITKRKRGRPRKIVNSEENV